MKQFTVSEKYQITCQLLPVGEDLCVILSGGDAPHIGAVSAGVVGAGVGAAHMTDAEKALLENAPVKSISFPSHRDGAMSEPLADHLSKRLGKNVVVLSGIHVDNLSKAGIAEITDLLAGIEDQIVRIITTDAPATV